MQRILSLLCIFILIYSCKKQSTEQQKTSIKYSETNRASKLSEEKTVGDFNGDNVIDKATIKFTPGVGNPLEDGTPDSYEVIFNNKIESIKAGCCRLILINEGDLNDDGKDEISLFQAPENGCIYTLKTYSYINNQWILIFDPFLIPTNCEALSEDEIQKRVSKEGNKLYIYVDDLNDEKSSLIKKEIFLKV